jgi:ubiquinone/menaquinone biosynthesis C-methylase UbiE
MTLAVYNNHAHYIAEGWSAQPKESFKQLAEIVASRCGLSGLTVLDIGCATGELLGFLSTQIDGGSFVGVDVTPELLQTGMRLLPEAHFVQASALALPTELDAGFDLVCSIGCMSIFDETQIETFWDNLFRVSRPGGTIIVMSPLNPYGVDAIIRHRKHINGKSGVWETGWNIFSVDTIAEIVAAHGAKLEIQPFRIGIDIAQRADPIRTWTIPVGDNPRQLTNGLKLLVDHEFMIVDRA